MKTDLELIDGNLIITTVDGTFSITLDVVTGEVIAFEYAEATLPKFSQFITKAKSRYNKFINSKAVEDFLR